MNFILIIFLFTIFCIIIFIYKTCNKISLFKNDYNILCIKKYLEKYKNSDILFMIHPGNAGDAVINYSTLELFKNINIKYKIIDKDGIYKKQNIIVSGGGNFVSNYNDVNKFLENNHEYNNILLLPCTINTYANILKKFNNNITIFVREKKSYEYVLKYFNHSKNLFLSDDMAFYLNINKIIKNNNNKVKYNILNAFRTDIEKTNIKIPKNNIDISKKFEILRFWTNENLIYKVSTNFINYINNFNFVNTNRLHVGIVSVLLNKNVNLYDNNYGKNRDIYNFSIKKKYKNIKFIL